MIFTDIIFPCFLLVVFLFYWLALRRNVTSRNVLLLAASYLFYGWWDWRFLGLIILTTLTTFFSALLAQGRFGRIATTVNIVFNVGLLFVFKYFNFFSENLERLFSVFGINLGWFTIDVLLPVGISFYTFQAIGYSVDVFRRKIGPCRNLLNFSTFIAYFPQLVAGPIERAADLLPQIEKERRWNTRYAVSGLRMALVGTVKKVCIADMCSVYVDRLFEGMTGSALQVVAVALLFTIEIYFDFSGYCDIARGVSRLLGIELMANFRFPYFSRNILEFWQRWHISLMLWFRDYIYIPLGGNRRGKRRTMVNTAAVFLLSGLWHGAAFNFIAWGAYWAMVYVGAKAFFGLKKRQDPVEINNLPDIILTFSVVTFGFYIFRCNTMPQFLAGLSNLWAFGLFFGLLWLAAYVVCRRNRAKTAVCVIAAAGAIVSIGLLLTRWTLLLKGWWLFPLLMVAILEWRSRNDDYTLQHMSRKRWQRYAIYWSAAICILLSEPIEMSFIYFQF